MKNVLLYFCLFATGFPAISSPTPNFTNIFKPGVYELKLQVKRKATVICTIKVAQYSPGTLNAIHGWGSDSLLMPTRTTIYEIRFRVDGEEVVVPLSCYADLTNPYRANLTFDGHDYRLIIEGAEDVLHYKALIYFNKLQVLKRTVHAIGNPKTWEGTTYHWGTTVYY